jgi:adenosine kinase
LAAVLGAIKIASRGAQNHRVDRDTVETRYLQAFRESPWG